MNGHGHFSKRLQYGVVNPGEEIERGWSKADKVDGPYKDGLLTIWLDDNGNEIQRWIPGESIELPVHEVLKVTGIDLDKVHTDLGPNVAPEAKFPEGVLTRMAGVLISIQLRYCQW